MKKEAFSATRKKRHMGLSRRRHGVRKRAHYYGHSSGAAPWPADEARKHENMARHILSRGHDYQHKGVDADNCAYCALRSGGADGPNYAGWAHLYIEAKKPIPKKWKEAFERELASDNRAYAGALERSIATFGAPRFV